MRENRQRHRTIRRQKRTSWLVIWFLVYSVLLCGAFRVNKMKTLEKEKEGLCYEISQLEEKFAVQNEQYQGFIGNQDEMRRSVSELEGEARKLLYAYENIDTMSMEEACEIGRTENALFFSEYQTIAISRELNQLAYDLSISTTNKSKREAIDSFEERINGLKVRYEGVYGSEISFSTPLNFANYLKKIFR